MGGQAAWQPTCDHLFCIRMPQGCICRRGLGQLAPRHDLIGGWVLRRWWSWGVACGEGSALHLSDTEASQSQDVQSGSCVMWVVFAGLGMYRVEGPLAQNLVRRR